MADKQALNATFFAFKKRERGGVLLGASIAYVVLALVIGGAFFLLNAQGIMDYFGWVTSISAQARDPSAPPSMDMMTPPPGVLALIPSYFLFLLVHYVLLAAYEAACLRWMIRGETGGLFGLSLNADTWRVYFTYWVWLFLLIAFYIVFAIVAGGAMFSLATMSQGNLSNAGPAAAVVPLVLGVLLLLGLVFFGVRFAPAAATSVARRKFAFFDAWTVSKGRFWALLGAFLLLFLMFFVLYFIAVGGFSFAVGATMISQVGQTGEPKTAEEAFRTFANPQFAAMIGAIILVMTVAALTLYVAMFGINARAAVAAIEEGKIKAEG